MENKFFMHRIKCTNGTWDKGIEIKDAFDDTKQSYHAYLGAYAYGHDANTDFVSCMITGITGAVLMTETWIKSVEPQPQEQQAAE